MTPLDETASFLSLERVGTLEEPNRAAQILRLTRKLCGWCAETFPGSQPVSLNRSNFQAIARNPYVACEKTDGIRYLLLAIDVETAATEASDTVGISALFLIDRNETVQRVPIHLPTREDVLKSHHKSLFDGEMVVDFIQDAEGRIQKRLRYLIYDAICILGDTSIMKYNLMQRLSTAHREVIRPLIDYLKLHKGEVETWPFDIYMKDFFEVWDISNIGKIASSLPHFSDGIIFTAVRPPYTPGTCSDLIKWKPPHLNTVDFSTQLLFRNSHAWLVKLYCMIDGMHIFKGLLAPYGETYKELLQEKGGKMDRTVVECYWVPEAPVYTFVPNEILQPSKKNSTDEIMTRSDDDKEGRWFEGGWVAERIRRDKMTANAHHVVKKVIESIEDGISYEELVFKFESLKKEGKPSVANFIAVQRNT